jgi:hypothetical protein
MSETVNKKNIIHSHRNITRNFSKLSSDKKYPRNKSELQDYINKSSYIKLYKPDKYLGLSQYQNNPTKSTFYSKLESNASTNYNNDNIQYIKTENNHPHLPYLKSISNKNDTISISTLFKLPDYKRKTINYFTKNSTSINKSNNSSKLYDNQNISNTFYTRINTEQNNNNTILLSNYNLDSERSIKKINNTLNNITFNKNKDKLNSKKKNYSNLDYFMKDKFYIDIEEKLNRQYKDKKFTHDHSIKDKLIELHQIKEFWGCIFNYVTPIIMTKRFQSITKLIEDRKKLRDINKKYGGNINNDKTKKFYNLSQKKNNNLTVPKICTDFNIVKQKKKEIKKEKKNKYTNTNEKYFN